MKYFFFVFGCIALFFTILAWKQAVDLSENGVVTEGTVTSINKVQEHSTKTMNNEAVGLDSYYVYYPIITFTTASGTKESFQSNNGSRTTSENLIGTHASVIYDPSNPSTASAYTFNGIWGSTIVGSVFTIIFFTLGFLIYFRSKRLNITNQPNSL